MLIGEPMNFRPLLEGFSLSFEGIENSGSPISNLLLLVSPTAIAWFVITVVIYAIKGFSFRAFAHICVEVFKRHPSFTDGNASSTVDRIGGIPLVRATPTHSGPQMMLCGSRLPMSKVSGFFYLQTPARAS